MSGPVWLHDGPVGSGPSAVRLPHTPAPCDDPNCVDGMVWGGKYSWDGDRIDYYECSACTRVVSPVVDLPEETCPTCEGRGWRQAAWDDAHIRWRKVECSTCGGKGTVRRLWHAVEQCRPDFPSDMPWVPACGSLDRCTMAGRPHERRLVVVGYSDTQPLNVVGDMRGDTWPGHAVVEVIGGHPFLWLGPDAGDCSDVVDEPWAQGLVPGDRVLRWESVVMLDEPITEQMDDSDGYTTCPYYQSQHGGPEGGTCNQGCYEEPACMTSRWPVPLQLIPGWNPSVELETP